MNAVCVCVTPPPVWFSFRRADGVMRTMNTDKLIKTLPTIQNQLDALLDFQVKERETQQLTLASIVSHLLLLLLCSSCSPTPTS